jgi:hypothetical protein
MISKGIRAARQRDDVAQARVLQAMLHHVLIVLPEAERGAE